MKETEMGDRGSKSDFSGLIPVKEQRVDGSRCGINSPHLRCTLTGFERNFQIRIPSNQINKQARFYSSKVMSQNELELNKVNMS